MPPIIQFLFLYVILPYCAVMVSGIFPCLAKRESIENSESTSCPLKTIWAWLTLAFLLIVGVFWFFKSVSSITDLLSGEIIGGTYFLSVVILMLCVLGFGAIRLILRSNKKKNLRSLHSQVLIPFAVIAVFSTLYGSTMIMEFFKRAFLITH